MRAYQSLRVLRTRRQVGRREGGSISARRRMTPPRPNGRGGFFPRPRAIGCSLTPGDRKFAPSRVPPEQVVQLLLASPPFVFPLLRFPSVFFPLLRCRDCEAGPPTLLTIARAFAAPLSLSRPVVPPLLALSDPVFVSVSSNAILRLEQRYSVISSDLLLWAFSFLFLFFCFCLFLLLRCIHTALIRRSSCS